MRIYLVMRCAGLRLYICAIGFAVMAAAACGHTVVDVLASLRLFSGTYASYRHSGVVPAIAAVAAIAFGFAAFTAISAAIGSFRRRFDLDRIATLSALPRPDLKAIALVFSLQIPTLLTIEAFEQIQRFGHPLGIAASLGGPPLIALAIHATCALLIASLSFRAIRAVTQAVLTLARVIAPLVLRTAIPARPFPAADLRVANANRRSGLAAPLALRIANRPPPQLAIS